MYVIVVGGGKVGYHLTSALLADGHEALLIEKDPRRYNLLRRLLGEVAFYGDGSEINVLERAGAARADALAAVTGSDEDNLIICQLAQNTFGIRKTVGRVSNPRNEPVWQELGLTHTVSSTRIIYSLLVEEVEAPGVIPLAILKRGDLELVEIVVPEHCPAAGNTVRNLNLPEDCVLFALARGTDLLIPRGDTEIRPGDTVFAVARRTSEPALRNLFCVPSGAGGGQGAS